KLDKSKLLEKVPFFLLTAIFSIVAIIAQQSSESIHTQLFDNILLSIMYPFYTIGFYLGKLFLPMNLSAYYGYPYPLELSAGEVVTAISVIAAIILYIYNIKKIKKGVNFGVMFFLISILPIIRIVPLGTTFAADRYMYLPIIGVFFALAMLLDSYALSKPAMKKALIAISLLYTVYFGVVSNARADVFKNSLNLWSDVMLHYPDSYDANLNLGVYYSDNKDNKKAREYFFNIVDTVGGKGRRNVLDDICQSYLNEDNLQEAKKYVQMLVSEFPSYPDGYMYLGYFKLRARDFAGGIKFYQKAVELDSDNPYTHYNYGNFLEQFGKNEQALKAYRQANSLDSTWADPINAINRLTRNNY
ncbi:tetratricopeptide repeat protein, partial [Thermodesulfobacteriota bacterium]